MSLTTSDEASAKAIRHANLPPPLCKRLAASKWILLASLLSLVTLLLTARSYLVIQSDLGAWGCRMSWMSPNYVRLAGPSGLGLKGLKRKYALWLYREGGLQPDVQVSLACVPSRLQLIPCALTSASRHARLVYSWQLGIFQASAVHCLFRCTSVSRRKPTVRLGNWVHR